MAIKRGSKDHAGPFVRCSDLKLLTVWDCEQGKVTEGVNGMLCNKDNMPFAGPSNTPRWFFPLLFQSIFSTQLSFFLVAPFLTHS